MGKSLLFRRRTKPKCTLQARIDQLCCLAHLSSSRGDKGKQEALHTQEYKRFPHPEHFFSDPS